MATVRTNMGRYYGKLLKDCTEFVMNKFCPNISDKIFINFVGVKRLRIKEGISGDCGSLDKDYRGREFEIRVDTDFLKKSNHNPELFVEHVMHELVHVKQCALGEHYAMFHKSYGKMVWKWLGEVYDYGGDEIEEEYWEQPWEVDAYGRQYGLMRLFFKKHPHWAEDLKVDLTSI